MIWNFDNSTYFTLPAIRRTVFEICAYRIIGSRLWKTRLLHFHNLIQKIIQVNSIKDRETVFQNPGRMIARLRTFKNASSNGNWKSKVSEFGNHKRHWTIYENAGRINSRTGVPKILSGFLRLYFFLKQVSAFTWTFVPRRDIWGPPFRSLHRRIRKRLYNSLYKIILLYHKRYNRGIIVIWFKVEGDFFRDIVALRAPGVV